MPSDFLIQIVHRNDGKIVAWAPGLEVEKQLISELLSRVKLKGVGLMRTEAHVLADVRVALEELLYDLKRQV